MRHLIQNAFRILLDDLGIDDKQQFMLLVVALLAALVVYLVRDRHRHGITFTFLFTVLTFAALIFLFTESEATRHWSALIGSLSIVAIFVWEFFRRRRASAAAAGESSGETSAAGQP